VPDSLLTILKFCFLALLYLFFIRVLRAVWAEMSPSRLAPPAPSPAARQPKNWGGGARSGGNSKAGGRLRVIEPPET
jgi:hypothetical protein